MVSLNNHSDQKHDCMITTAYTICFSNVHAGCNEMCGQEPRNKKKTQYSDNICQVPLY